MIYNDETLIIDVNGKKIQYDFEKIEVVWAWDCGVVYIEDISLVKNWKNIEIRESMKEQMKDIMQLRHADGIYKEQKETSMENYYESRGCPNELYN